MASFYEKKKYDTERFCSVCREKKLSGRILRDYKDSLDFVCDECYKSYFKNINTIEKMGFGVLYRPARIIKDELRMPQVLAPVLVFDMIKWVLCACGIWLIILAFGIIYRDTQLRLYPLDIAMLVVYAFFSGIGALRAVFLLVRGMFYGMDHKRRLLLLLKIILYTGVAAFHGAVFYLSLAQGSFIWSGLYT